MAKQVEDMSEIELKALAYDILVSIERANGQLRQVNDLIKGKANGLGKNNMEPAKESRKAGENDKNTRPKD